MLYRLILIFVLATSSLAQAKINFIEVKDFGTWEQMVALAKANNKSLFVFIESFPCPDCKELKKNTFKNKELSKVVKADYLALQIADYWEVGKALANLYMLENMPQVLVLNTNEDIFYKHEGAISASDLISELQQAKSMIANYPKWKAGDNISKLDYINFLLIEELNGRCTPMDYRINSVAAMLDSTDFNLPQVQRFVMNLVLNSDNAIFQAIKSHPNWLKNSDNFNWQIYFQEVYNFNIGRAVDQQDSVLLEDVLYQLKQFPVSDSIIQNLELKGRQLYTAELDHWRAYDSITRAYLTQLPADSANAYQREALFLLENYQADQPTALATKYVKLGLEKKETFELYYTLSLILFNENDLVNSYKAAYKAYNITSDENNKVLARKMLELIDSYY